MRRMHESVGWRRLYEVAMLELNLAELPNAIAAARSAMELRIQELRTAAEGEGMTSTEIREIADAMHSLRSLERHECAPLNVSTPASDLSVQEKAS